MSAAEPTSGHFPDKVGKYELLLPIGTGATATVFLARTRGVAGFEREVALKLVHAHLRGDEESKLHLLDEARLAAKIRHPNVVSVTEVDADPFGVFLVMDYVEGDTLSGLVRVLRERNQRLPPRLVARIVNDALAGLHAAHELRDADGQLVGLVHRDFSPQNILVGVEGVTRLADFGVAKAASRAVRTKTGLVKGKIAYMSPEQARGHRLDRRCDVWAAGVVAWELIAGRRLYEHEDEVATLLTIVTQEPARLRDVIRGVPTALEEAVSYALTSDLNSRCPSAEAFRSLLEAAWQEIGGMASAAEVAAFVRSTVGPKLNERRAHVARRGTGGANAAGAAPAPGLPAPRNSAPPSPSTPPPLPLREEATKTAISAAVPAAAPAGAVGRRRNFWQERSLMIGAAAGVLVLGAIALPVFVQPSERSSTAAQAAPSAEPAKASRGQEREVKAPAARSASTPPADVVEPAQARPVDSGDPGAPSGASAADDDSSAGGAAEAVDPPSSKSANGSRTAARGASSSRQASAKKSAKARRPTLAEAMSRSLKVDDDKPEKAEKKSTRKRANPTTRLAPDPYQSDN